MTTGLVLPAALTAVVTAALTTAAGPARADTDPATGTPTAAAAGAAAGTDAANAAEPAKVASSTPLPTVQVDGVVWAQVTVGNTVFATGHFANARPAGAAPGTHLTARGNLLAYDIRTGALIGGFAHTLNAQGLALTASPDGKVVYVGGQFTQVDGHARSRVAAFSTTSGALLSYAPTPNSTVSAIAVTSSTVYLGGAFSAVGGNARGKLAATTTAGALLPWAPRASSTVRGLVAMPQFRRVYAAGSFSSVNNRATYGVSAVDATSGASIDVPVSQQIIATSHDSSSAGIYSLRTDGTRIYGGGYNALSASFPQFEGTFAMDPATGQVQWVNDCWGDTYDAAPVAGLLYVASHVHNCVAAGFFKDTGNHFYGTAFGLTAGNHNNVKDSRGWDYSRFRVSSYSGWQPPFKRGPSGQAVWSFTGNGAYVSAGGDFPGVGKSGQQGLARFAVTAPGAGNADDGADDGADGGADGHADPVAAPAPAEAPSAG